MNAIGKRIIFHALAGRTLHTYKCPVEKRDGEWFAVFAHAMEALGSAPLLFPLLSPIDSDVPKCLAHEAAEFYSPVHDNRFPEEFLARLALCKPHEAAYVELDLKDWQMKELGWR